jgi:hypothetical protein
VSDEEQRERTEDRAEDVEAHRMDEPIDAPDAAATEEPPDVEGHRMDPRPVDSPVD